MPYTGDDIKQARQRRRWSQEQLARAAGVGPRTVGRIERGEVADPRSLAALVTALGLADTSAAAWPTIREATVYELYQELGRRMFDQPCDPGRHAQPSPGDDAVVPYHDAVYEAPVSPRESRYTRVARPAARPARASDGGQPEAL